MAHPRRLNLASALVSALDGRPSLALDPDPGGQPSALRSVIVAWERVPDWAMHHLVLQDHVQPGADLLATVEAAAAEQPEAALAFYAHWLSWNGARTRIAARAG